MNTYSTTESLYRKREATTQALRKATRKLRGKKRKQAIARAATMPIGQRQELQAAIEAERCAGAIAEAIL